MVGEKNPVPACRFLAEIDASQCIGCNFCRQACPFDAIVGALETLYCIIDGYCTGCGDCIAPCPVDCISLISNPDFTSCTHEQRVEFAVLSKSRKQGLARRRELQDETSRSDFNDRKQRIKQQAKSTIDALKQKLQQP